MLSMIFLSDDERAQLRAQHKLERDGRIRDRIKAVLLFDKGWSVAAIAEALLLSEDAIRTHVTEYKESKKLKPENGGSVQKLSSEHSDKKPALVPGKANEQQQREWLAQYEKLKFGFFATLSTLDAESVLGQTFRSRVRDRFRLIGAPI
jgi:predicted ArsR family transcriptional regulator